MEFTKKAKDLKRGMPHFKHRLAEHCRKLFAVLICTSMVLSGFPSAFFQAFAADESGDYVFELDKASLYEALDTAIAEGTTLNNELDFLGEHKAEYDELFEPDGTLYELEDLEIEKDRERDKEVGLRVFVRVEGDIGLEEAYEIEGSEEFIFLLTNKADEELSVQIVLDDRETEVIAIPAAKDIPVEIDENLSTTDEETEEISVTEGLEGLSTAGGAGAGGEGDGTYSEAESTDEDKNSGEAADVDTESVEKDSDADDAAESETGKDSSEKEDPSESSDGSSDNGTDKEASSDDDTDKPDKGSHSNHQGSSDGKDSSESSKDKDSSDDKDSSKDKDTSKDKDSSKEKDPSEKDSSGEKDSSADKDSSNDRGISGGRTRSERKSNGRGRGGKTASVSVNKTQLLAAAIETEPEKEDSEEVQSENNDETITITASPSNASPSDASPSDASNIIDGTVYDPVRLGKRGAVAFATTASDLGLDEDLDMVTTLIYEGEDYIVTVSYGRDANLPRNVELLASEYDKESDTFQERFEEASEFNGWDEDNETIVDRIRLFNVSLSSDGTEVEPEAEVEIQISLLDSEEPGENKGCYSVFHFADTEIEAIDPTNEYEDEVQTITFSVSSFSDIMLLSEGDPEFTVQFWANLDTIYREHHGEDTDLTVIETHTDNGAVLPSNGTNPGPSTSVIELKSDGKGGFVIDSENVLTQMYTDEAYEFIYEPDVHTMNKLELNGDYELIEIWKLNSGGDPESTNNDKNDWTVYEVSRIGDTENYTMEFTNDPDASGIGETLILVQDDDVFRFVYDTSTADAYLDANFYDYNVGDGNVYAGNSTSSGQWSSGTKYINVGRQGINNTSNYSGSGIALGFGNNNVQTGLGTLYWNGNQLNKYNNNGLLGCTFGLPSSLNTNTNVITFSSDVDAPNLYSGTAVGKETFSNQQLEFIREGDTYTLSAVSGSDGVGVTGLESFENPGSYTSIYTNSFWPLDNVSYTGMDPLFGSGSDVHYFGINNDTGASAEGTMPASDDGTDHNSYFGMNFVIEFEYSKDYVGPLEYFFFGDDDMWVFLDSQLVIDIGGVHSSVGEHVDLWDYLASERNSLGDDEVARHTLSVFYTERGASGSTCYIQYTLPEVSSVTPVDDASNLIIEKEVVGIETDQEFEFRITLTDAGGNELSNQYSCIITNASGLFVESDPIKSGDTFTLQDGWSIEIRNLPNGTIATVTELDEYTDSSGNTVSNVLDGYSTTYEVGSITSDTETATESGAGTTASGSVSDEGTTYIKFINTAGYRLPDTGGSGQYPFQIAGVLLLMSSVTMLYVLLRRRRLTINR